RDNREDDGGDSDADTYRGGPRPYDGSQALAGPRECEELRFGQLPTDQQRQLRGRHVGERHGAGGDARRSTGEHQPGREPAADLRRRAVRRPQRLGGLVGAPLLQLVERRRMGARGERGRVSGDLVLVEHLAPDATVVGRERRRRDARLVGALLGLPVVVLGQRVLGARDPGMLDGLLEPVVGPPPPPRTLFDRLPDDHQEVVVHRPPQFTPAPPGHPQVVRIEPVECDDQVLGIGLERRDTGRVPGLDRDPRLEDGPAAEADGDVAGVPRRTRLDVVTGRLRVRRRWWKHGCVRRRGGDPWRPRDPRIPVDVEDRYQEQGHSLAERGPGPLHRPGWVPSCLHAFLPGWLVLVFGRALALRGVIETASLIRAKCKGARLTAWPTASAEAVSKR